MEFFINVLRARSRLAYPFDLHRGSLCGAFRPIPRNRFSGDIL